MRETAYTSAVTRVRANENSLLTSADLDRLLGAKDADEVLSFLSDKGYGGGGVHDVSVFSKEQERAWGLIREIAPDFSLFYPMLVRNDFHNAKAILKGIIAGLEYDGLLLSPSVLSVSELRTAVSDRKFGSLPDWIRDALSSAYDALAHSGDGQLADVTLDRAYLDAVHAYGKGQKDPFVAGYCECLVRTTDLRIAARAAAIGKSAVFLEAALADCDSLSIRELRLAAQEGTGTIVDLLTKHGENEPADALKHSVAALERWCDNQFTDYIRQAQYAVFGISPLYQYMERKNAEISAARIIYTGKRSGFPEEKIKSYLRALA